MKRHLRAGLSLLSGAAILTVSGLASAEESRLDTRWYIAPGVNYTFTEGSASSNFDRDADENLGGNLAFGRAVSKSFNLDLRLSGADLPGVGSGQNTEHYSFNADLLYFPNRNRVAPYVKGGVGVMRTVIGGNHSTNPVANFGVGVQGQFADSGAAIRADLNWRVDFYDNQGGSSSTTEYGEFVPSLNLVLPLSLDPARTERTRQSLAAAGIDKRWHLGLSVGWLWPDAERDNDFGFGDGNIDGGLSYAISANRAVSEKWNTEFRLFGAELEINNSTNGGEFDFYGAVASAQYFINRNPRFAPFIEAGLGAMRSEVSGKTSTNPIFEAGLGFVSQLNDNGLSLRVGARARLDTYDISDNTRGTTEFVDWETYAGLLIPLGARTVVSAPVPVVTAAPTTVIVSQDDDNDGVNNDRDSCPSTRAGVIVDSSGCEPDGDNDGVGDQTDRCPFTPAGQAVGLDGCALDDDRDGILNNLDKCPNTAAGQAVDTNGCALAEIIVVYFESDSSQLTAVGKAKLDKIAQQMVRRDYVVAVVGGHADSRGSISYNERLAKRRASSVKSYLVARGVRSGSLTAKSFGELEPIGDNATRAGRALNRRVEVKVLNP